MILNILDRPGFNFKIKQVPTLYCTYFIDCLEFIEFIAVAVIEVSNFKVCGIFLSFLWV